MMITGKYNTRLKAILRYEAKLMERILVIGLQWRSRARHAWNLIQKLT